MKGIQKQRAATWSGQAPNITFNQVHTGWSLRRILLLVGLLLLGATGGGFLLAWSLVANGEEKPDRKDLTTTTSVSAPLNEQSAAIPGCSPERSVLCVTAGVTVKLGFHPPERLAAATVERADPLLRWGCPGTDVANAVRADRVWLQSDTKDWLFVAYQLRSATEARDAIAAIAAMARTCTADAFTYTGHPAPDIGDAAALVSLVDKEGVVVDCFGQTERQLMSRCRQDELFFAIGDHVVQAYLYGEWYPGSEAEYLDELIRIGEAAESALR